MTGFKNNFTVKGMSSRTAPKMNNDLAGYVLSGELEQVGGGGKIYGGDRYFVMSHAPIVFDGVIYGQSVYTSNVGVSYALVDKESRQMLELSRARPYAVISGVDGLTAWGVGCCETQVGGSAGVRRITMYFRDGDFIDGVNPHPGTDDMEYGDTWIRAVTGQPNIYTVYFKKSVWVPGGANADYAWRGPSEISFSPALLTDPYFIARFGLAFEVDETTGAISMYKDVAFDYMSGEKMNFPRDGALYFADMPTRDIMGDFRVACDASGIRFEACSRYGATKGAGTWVLANTVRLLRLTVIDSVTHLPINMASVTVGGMFVDYTGPDGTLYDDFGIQIARVSQSLEISADGYATHNSTIAPGAVAIVMTVELSAL